MEDLSIATPDPVRVREKETEYVYLRAFIELLYQDYDWQFGAYAYFEGADQKNIKHAKLAIKKAVPKLIKEYFLAKRNEQGLNTYLMHAQAKRLDEAFCLMTDVLLKARQALGHVVEIQFTLTDRFLYACWLLCSTNTAIAVFSKILPHAFTFPKIDFETQFKACCKSAQKAHLAYTADKENVSRALESVYVHFGFVCDLIDLWRKNKQSKDTKQDARLESLLYEWNAVHYIMPLYIAIHGFVPEDAQFKQIARNLFDYAPQNQLTQMAIQALLDSAEKLPELNSPKLSALHQRIVARCNQLLKMHQPPARVLN